MTDSTSPTPADADAVSEEPVSVGGAIGPGIEDRVADARPPAPAPAPGRGAGPVPVPEDDGVPASRPDEQATPGPDGEAAPEPDAEAAPGSDTGAAPGPDADAAPGPEHPAPGARRDVESILRHRREAEQSLLDEFWDFADPAASEARFRDAADDAAHPARLRSVFATQLARALGLQSRFDEGEAVLVAVESEPVGTGSRAVVRADDAEPGPLADADADAEAEAAAAIERAERAALRARIALERGRLLASSGRPAEAVPVCTLAAREAATAGSAFLVLDALHMLALADVGHEEEWAAEAAEVLGRTRDPRARRWGVAVGNNLGWHLHDLGRPDDALVAFERAATAADDYGTREQQQLARWAIARCLRTLGRLEEALEIQRSLAVARPGDRWVHAEIAVLEAGLGRAATTANPPATASGPAGPDAVSEDAPTIEP